MLQVSRNQGLQGFSGECYCSPFVSQAPRVWPVARNLEVLYKVVYVIVDVTSLDHVFPTEIALIVECDVGMIPHGQLVNLLQTLRDWRELRQGGVESLRTL